MGRSLYPVQLKMTQRCDWSTNYIPPRHVRYDTGEDGLEVKFFPMILGNDFICAKSLSPRNSLFHHDSCLVPMAQK